MSLILFEYTAINGGLFLRLISGALANAIYKTLF